MIKKIFRKIWIFVYLLFHQKKYLRQKYVFEKHNDKRLLIIFSAFPKQSRRGGYNYLWSLRKVKVNKLWIRDRFGSNGAGTYYLGEDFPSFDSFVKEIDAIISKYSEGKITYFCGTSKGGSAALLYGLRLNGDFIICGSPQYYIGSYLSENAYHRQLMAGICRSSNAKDLLNDLLPKEVSKHGNKKVFLLISKNEKSYAEHLKPLIYDLEQNQYQLSVFDARYQNHDEVGLYFVSYIEQILKGESEWLTLLD